MTAKLLRNIFQIIFLILLVFALVNSIVAIDDGYKDDGGVTDSEAEIEDMKKRQTKRDISKKPLIGSIGLKLSFGLSDFNSDYQNSSETRRYSLEYPFPTAGFELSLRMGHDKNKFFSSKNGPTYYRSNKSFFLDMELGGKFFCGIGGTTDNQNNCRPPTHYTYQRTNSANALGKSTTVHTDSLAELRVSDNRSAANADGISDPDATFRATGQKAAFQTTVYFNNYFHFTPLNYIMNFGSSFRWFDSSFGPSLRISRYGDYGDPLRMQSINNDAIFSNLDLVIRLFMHIPFTKDRIRLRAHGYYPLFSQINRLFRGRELNNEEYIVDGGIDVFIIKFVYISAGFEYSYWKINPNSPDRLNQFRSGFEQTQRSSYFGYITLGIEIPIGQ